MDIIMLRENHREIDSDDNHICDIETKDHMVIIPKYNRYKCPDDQSMVES